MLLDEILKLAQDNSVSDVILKAGSVPIMRHAGKLLRVGNAQKITNTIIYHMVSQVLPSHLEQKFSADGDVDFAYQTNSARFRVNLYKEQQRLSLVLRLIKDVIPAAEELMLPPVIGRFAQHRRGLILVTGASGSGKSTTVAYILNLINQQCSYHIVTIEDPIEYVFKEKSCTISQREVGIDTPSFQKALRSVLRQDPDVIFVGELRDKETIEVAMQASETGHLVISTLHTSGCVDTVSRIMSYFEPSKHASVKLTLARCLNGIISQRLVTGTQNNLVCAFEVMLASSFVRECILRKDNFDDIDKAIKEGAEKNGMISFDNSLLQLYQNRHITRQAALYEADSPADLELKMRGVG